MCGIARARFARVAPDVLELASPPSVPAEALTDLEKAVVVCGDASEWLVALPENSVDLFFTSPPYADARPYCAVRPDDYVEWFEPFAEAMLKATADSGSMVVNIKNRVASSGTLRGQRHPYVFDLVLRLQSLGWRWLETYVWHKPNAVPGRFGPRPKDSFEFCFHFSKGFRPYFDLDAVRVPYRADAGEIERRRRDTRGRRNTEAGFGRDRSKVYSHGAADPGNVVSVPQTYNQHKGPAGAHTAVMPERVAEHFVKMLCPPAGLVVDPFAGSGTTVVAARAHGRRGAGIELHPAYAAIAVKRVKAASAVPDR